MEGGKIEGEKRRKGESWKIGKMNNGRGRGRKGKGQRWKIGRVEKW